MKCLCILCEISCFTELSCALVPLSSSRTEGCADPTPERPMSEMSPPATERKGRTVSRTPFTASSSSAGASGKAWTTSEISGMASISRRSRPILIVIVEDGHVPHAPTSSRRTMGPSMESIWTLPPSAMRYGLISSKIISTFSSVRGSSTSPPAPLPALPGLNGDSMEATPPSEASAVFERCLRSASAEKAPAPRSTETASAASAKNGAMGAKQPRSAGDLEGV
mmetsp:Transcript_26259/g.88255  ORF Transcript_26259/g.88255 Transcript_26259/m.88255 type:complete len:224 (+) Transcript_26259:113-784(+)